MHIKNIFPVWKLIVHLVFRTKHFGVNNQWWVHWDSFFGYNFLEKVKLLLNPKAFKVNIKCIHIRSLCLYFMSDNEVWKYYGMSRENAIKKYLRSK